MENNNCSSCNFCDSCDSCNFCDSCNSCDSCDLCDFCNFCNFCDFCDFCVKLKMTESNYFCFSDDYNSDTSFQQPRYRIFNTQLTKEEYDAIRKVKMNLEFDGKEALGTRYKTAFRKAWEKLSEEDKNKITSLPGFTPEIFLKYWGVDVEVSEDRYKRPTK